jgi:hypothetical protein
MTAISTVLAFLLLAEPATPYLTPRPEVLSGAFEPGFVANSDEDRYPMRIVSLGDLSVPSGRLILGDAVVMYKGDGRQEVQVPPGRYPVELAIANTGRHGEGAALARVRLSAEKPVRWRMSVSPEDAEFVAAGESYSCYSVDSGTGAFMDGDMVDRVMGGSEASRERIVEGWFEAAQPMYETPGVFGLVLQKTFGAGEIAQFNLGGDGCYVSWLGYDAADRLAVVVTDLNVIDASNERPAPPSRSVP